MMYRKELIDTQWDVNIAGLTLEQSFHSELIDTQWDVNADSEAVKKGLLKN